MANIERILIVGGGIAGLTLAIALHRQGFRAELVERSTAWQALSTDMGASVTTSVRAEGHAPQASICIAPVPRRHARHRRQAGPNRHNLRRCQPPDEP